MTVQVNQFPLLNGPEGTNWVSAVLNDNGSLSIEAVPSFAILCIVGGDQPNRPAQIGDVLSMEPHGYWQARPADAPNMPGPNETFAKHPTLPLLQFNASGVLVPQSVVYKLA